jgi:hypothetical protein
MPTAKKAQPRGKAGDTAMASNSTWRWVYLIGALIAGLVAAFGFKMLDPWLGLVLLIAGFLVGLFYFDSGDVVNFGIRFLVFAAVAGALGKLDAILSPVGSFLTNFFTGIVGFLGPVVLAMLIMYFWKKYFAS